MVLGRVIHLVGPGGAGKSTVGRSLAQRLGVAFLDLDEQFMARAGDISAYLDAHGYEAYAAENVRAYLDASIAQDAVFALSSGFMTYSSDVHPAYHELRSSRESRDHVRSSAIPRRRGVRAGDRSPSVDSAVQPLGRA